MGILRSLGALARALGPILSATGERGLALLPAFADIQCHSGSLQPRRVGSAARFQSHKVFSAEVGTPESCTRGRTWSLLAPTKASRIS